jgi:hypothetical protein
MNCRKTILKNLNREHGIVSAHWPLPEHICTTLIAKQMPENVIGTNGPNNIQKRIALRMVFLLLGKFSDLFVLLSVCSLFSGQRFAKRCMHSIQAALPVVFYPSGHQSSFYID